MGSRIILKQTSTKKITWEGAGWINVAQNTAHLQTLEDMM
jgi:hypothetical protein